MEAYGQVQAILESEYTPEDAQAIGLTSLSDLQTYLEELCDSGF
jgi:hypothetical protein